MFTEVPLSCHSLIKRVIGLRHFLESEFLLHNLPIEPAHLASERLRMSEFANCTHQLIDGARLAQVPALFVFGVRMRRGRSYRRSVVFPEALQPQELLDSPGDVATAAVAVSRGQEAPHRARAEVGGDGLSVRAPTASCPAAQLPCAAGHRSRRAA